MSQPSTDTPANEANYFPLPTGTRDVLPAEMAEQRTIISQVLGVFGAAGYGEVATPAFEYEDVVASWGSAGSETARAAYRFPDELGRTLVARYDSTVPIARMAATRFSDVDLPLRFCYVQDVYRPVAPKRGDAREFLQVGGELLGLAEPDGDVEVVSLLCRLLDAVGLQDYRLAVGDAHFFAGILSGSGVSEPAVQAPVLHELQTRDYVGLRRELASSGLTGDRADELLKVAMMRGGSEVLGGPGTDRLSALHTGLSVEGLDDRVVYDLGMARAPGYYTGIVFEIYARGVGLALGGGGRYDTLLGRFGMPAPACGFALNAQRLHAALVAEESS